MKKRYQLEYQGSFPMVIEIDDEIFTEAILKEWNEFWGAHEQRADTEAGPLIPLLKMTYRVVLVDSISSWSAVASLREGREEGFQKMDGSQGITIVSYEDFEFDEYDMDVRELVT